MNCGPGSCLMLRMRVALSQNESLSTGATVLIARLYTIASASMHPLTPFLSTSIVVEIPVHAGFVTVNFPASWAVSTLQHSKLAFAFYTFEAVNWHFPSGGAGSNYFRAGFGDPLGVFASPGDATWSNATGYGSLSLWAVKTVCSPSSNTPSSTQTTSQSASHSGTRSQALTESMTLSASSSGTRSTSVASSMSVCAELISQHHCYTLCD